ncbi:MAG: hypothetical protein LBJ00_15115 [Planctomycetaceae bacterium]|nr:hypothetical protein [Planctomycetaceae bacterium]
MKRLLRGEAYRLTGYGINNSRNSYTQAVLKFLKLNTQAQQREAVVRGRSLSPYRLRYIQEQNLSFISVMIYFLGKIYDYFCFFKIMT